MGRKSIASDTNVAIPASTSLGGGDEAKQLPSSREGLARDEVQPAVEQHQMIATAAYFLAERRGFAPGAELEDWVQAEAETTTRLSSRPSH